MCNKVESNVFPIALRLIVQGMIFFFFSDSLASSITWLIYREGILVKAVNRADFLLDNCRWWNNNGGVVFRDVTDSNLHLLNGHWTQNRGISILAEKIKGRTNISIENNDFRQNNGFQNNTMFNSVIELEMSENDGGLHFTFFNEILHDSFKLEIKVFHFQIQKED